MSVRFACGFCGFYIDFCSLVTIQVRFGYGFFGFYIGSSGSVGSSGSIGSNGSVGSNGFAVRSVRNRTEPSVPTRFGSVPRFSVRKVPALHTPKFPSPKSTKKGEQSKRAHDSNSRSIDGKNYTGVPIGDKGGFGNDQRNDRLFTNNKIHDALMGIGEYADFALPDREFGLGFKRSYSEDGKLIGFGHSGIGGSTGYCDINNRFALGVTLNKMNMGGVTAKVTQLVCSELNIPLPADFYRYTERLVGNESNIAVPLIN
ncbi:hypothetical protein OROGR_026986 [Orobanche gracilis]